MSVRRIVVVLLLAGIVMAAFPGAVEAWIVDGEGSAPGPEDGLLSRIAAWAESLLTEIKESFTSQEGAAITGNG